MSDELLYIPTVVPVFPLPGIVLFPHSLAPLHVFEPRYRAMTADALEGDGIIALALLKEGWEPLYHTLRAPIHPTLGIGRIMQSEQTAKGDYNLLLHGVGRAQVLEELEPDDEDDPEAYRRARVETMETWCSAADLAREQMRDALFDAIAENPGLGPDVRENWLKLREVDSFGDLMDMLSAGLPSDAELRQILLSEPDEYERGRMLLRQMGTLAAVGRMYRRLRRPEELGMN